MTDTQPKDKIFKSKDEVIMNKIRWAIKARTQDLEPKKVSVQQAILHSLSTRVARDKSESKLLPGEKITYCECCARQIQKEELDIKCNTIDLSFIGSAYVSYLEFIKFCVNILVAFFLSSGLFNIITNSAFGEDCLPNHVLDDQTLQDLGYLTIFDNVFEELRKKFMSKISKKFIYFDYISLHQEQKQTKNCLYKQYIKLLKLNPKYKLFYHQNDIFSSPSFIQIILNPSQIIQQIGGQQYFYTFYKQQDECIRNWVTIYSLGNKRSKQGLMVAQSFFNLISLLICVYLFQRFRLQLRKIEKQCDESEVCAQDYTLLISNIPDEFTYEGDISKLDYTDILKEFLHKNLAQDQPNDKNKKSAKDIQQEGSNQQNQNQGNTAQNQADNKLNQIQIEVDNLKNEPQYIEIVSVGLCYDLKKYFSIETNLETIKKKESKTKKEAEKAKLKELLSKLSKQREEFPKEYIPLGNNRYKIQNFTGYAYVILQYEEDQQKVQDFYQEIEFITSLIVGHKTKTISFEGRQIQITAAPDPNNIFWENLRHSFKALVIRRSALFVATLLVLGGCLGLLFSFQLIQMKVGAQENKDSPVVTIMSYSISVSIILLNAGVQFSIFLIAKKEARSTKAGFFDSMVVKHAVAHFLNTSVLLLIIQVFIYKDGDGFGKLFKAVRECPSYLGKEYQIRFYETRTFRKVIEVGYSRGIEFDPKFDLQMQYSILISSVFSALFYAPIIPFCLIWSIIQLFLKYWVDKYTIIKKSTLNVGPNINACLDVVENLEYCLPIYSLANLFFFIYISKNNTVDQLSILGVIVGIIHAILPMQFLNERIYKLEDNNTNTQRYEDICHTFLTDYDRENPIKKEKAMKMHYKALKSKAKKENKIDFNNSIYDPCNEITDPTPANKIQGKKVGDQQYVPSRFGNIRFVNEENYESENQNKYLENKDNYNESEKVQEEEEVDEQIQHLPKKEDKQQKLHTFSNFMEDIILKNQYKKNSKKIEITKTKSIEEDEKEQSYYQKQNMDSKNNNDHNPSNKKYNNMNFINYMNNMNEISPQALQYNSNSKNQTSLIPCINCGHYSNLNDIHQSVTNNTNITNNTECYPINSTNYQNNATNYKKNSACYQNNNNSNNKCNNYDNQVNSHIDDHINNHVNNHENNVNNLISINQNSVESHRNMINLNSHQNEENNKYNDSLKVLLMKKINEYEQIEQELIKQLQEKQLNDKMDNQINNHNGSKMYKKNLQQIDVEQIDQNNHQDYDNQKFVKSIKQNQSHFQSPEHNFIEEIKYSRPKSAFSPTEFQLTANHSEFDSFKNESQPFNLLMSKSQSGKFNESKNKSTSQRFSQS